MQLLASFNIKLAIVTAVVASLLLSYSFPHITRAQQSDTATSSEETTGDTTNTDNSSGDGGSDQTSNTDNSSGDGGSDQTSNTDNSSGDGASDQTSNDTNESATDESNGSDVHEAEKRAKLLQRLVELRTIVEERKAAIAAQHDSFSVIRDTVQDTTKVDMTGLSPEERRAHLLERVAALRAMVAERRAAVETRQTSFSDQRAKLMERVQALKDLLAARKAERDGGSGDDTGGDSVTSFGLDDVATVTSKYVDPDPLLADEEYTEYSIELNDGTEVVVKESGFVPVETQEQVWRDAGYTGDIAALKALSTEETNSAGAVLGEQTTRRALLEQKLAALKDLVAALKSRLGERGGIGSQVRDLVKPTSDDPGDDDPVVEVVILEFVSADAALVANSDTTTDDDMGEFELRFEVTALDDDRYISNQASFAYGNQEGLVVLFKLLSGSGDKIDDTAFDAISATLSSTADEEANRYVVDEGSTEEFTLTVVADPTVAGEYALALWNEFHVEAFDGTVSTQSIDSAEFQSSYLAI